MKIHDCNCQTILLYTHVLSIVNKNDIKLHVIISDHLLNSINVFFRTSHVYVNEQECSVITVILSYDIHSWYWNLHVLYPRQDIGGSAHLASIYPYFQSKMWEKLCCLRVTVLRNDLPAFALNSGTVNL